MVLRGEPFGGNVVCEQREWDAMQASRPGQHLLVRSGIATEQEAEKLARGTAGDVYGRGPGKRAQAPRDPAPPIAPGSAPPATPG
jgi:hypothetical protein